jgi:hypothetical protein
VRTGLLSDLSVIGYEILLEGETIRLRYQKPDTPPESARQLIDELRKYKSEAVNILKTVRNVTPQTIVEPKVIVSAIWTNPHKQGTPEARLESLFHCMEATWVTAFDRIAAIWPQGFLSTPEIHTAEIEIERIQTLVLSGKAKLSDFRQAIATWERMVKQGVTQCIIKLDDHRD